VVVIHVDMTDQAPPGGEAVRGARNWLIALVAGWHFMWRDRTAMDDRLTSQAAAP
jgi:hypothetical protein